MTGNGREKGGRWKVAAAAVVVILLLDWRLYHSSVFGSSHVRYLLFSQAMCVCGCVWVCVFECVASIFWLLQLAAFTGKS